eukprot:TRINITY_DN13762_c0_g1_i2.p1 TRINITY_DN13762_c0_g1~~TRINITY_DN13762_c0_g1_i2.p1  ORF type:complete len:150 (+),score=32.74 TRINITY_DN13762_c0_g1_i2:40-489(+)
MPDTAVAGAVAKVTRSDAEWQELLSTKEYRVLRLCETDDAYKGHYTDMLPEGGHFACRGCQLPLYSAGSKFSCTCGWPAFRTAYLGHVVRRGDPTCALPKAEIVCAACDSHLGHVFTRASAEKQRHCVNSSSIVYLDEDPAEGMQVGRV